MNKVLLGALAFATGVIVENKYNVTDRILKACSKSETDVPEEQEEYEPTPSE